MLMFDILSRVTNGARNEYGYSDEARPPVGGLQYPRGKRKEEIKGPVVVLVTILSPPAEVLA